MKTAPFAVALFLVLASCGKQASSPDAPNSVKSPAPSISTAKDVTDALQSAGLKLTDISVVTEANDGNNLLGRPHQYTSKVFFFDLRHPKAPDSMDDPENTIEVFDNPEDAKARYDYVDGVTKNVPMLLTYQILNGRVLVRLSKVMLPSEVDAYRKAVAKLPE